MARLDRLAQLCHFLKARGRTEKLREDSLYLGTND